MLNKLVKFSSFGSKKIIRQYSNYANQIEIRNGKNVLELILKEKSHEHRTLRFNPHWLRFNCHSEKSVQSSSGQRIIDVDSVPQHLLIDRAEITGNELRIVWDRASCQDDSFIPIEFLIHNNPDFSQKASASPKFKTANELEFFDYNSFIGGANHNDERKRSIYFWLKHLSEYGICIVKNVPTNENMVRNVAEIIAPLQRTIYGEIFDVKAEANPINIAYSTAKLGFHMDLIYYESAPGIQFLHCLKFDDTIKGGESLFLDLFHVVEEFRRAHPTLFDSLTRIPATFKKIHFDRERPVFMFYQKPHIQLNHRSKIVAVNWAPPFEGTLLNLTQEEIRSYYESYLSFSKFINNHKDQIVYRLRPGEVACFNNRRILHARNEFQISDKTKCAATRHFQGCYINIDEFKSEALILENYFKHKENKNVRRLELSSIAFGNQDFY